MAMAAREIMQNSAFDRKGRSEEKISRIVKISSE
jgi:hypothetical protein